MLQFPICGTLTPLTRTCRQIDSYFFVSLILFVGWSCWLGGDMEIYLKYLHIYLFTYSILLYNLIPSLFEVALSSSFFFSFLMFCSFALTFPPI